MTTVDTNGPPKLLLQTLLAQIFGQLHWKYSQKLFTVEDIYVWSMLMLKCWSDLISELAMFGSKPWAPRGEHCLFGYQHLISGVARKLCLQEEGGR